MKLRSLFSVLITVVIVLLALGGAGFYWIAAQSPLKILQDGPTGVPQAAVFVPKQAPAMVSFLVKPDRLEAFRIAVADPQDRRQAREELEQLKQRLLMSAELSYQQDVQPWIGNELTLAVTSLDIDRDRTNGRQPGYLLAVSTTDAERSREFLQLFWQKRALAGIDLMFEQYKGVKLIYASERSPAAQSAKAKQPTSPYFVPALASAVVGDQFVLFANHPKVLREAINNVQAPDLSLIRSRLYDQAIQSFDHPRIGLAVLNLPGLTRWLVEEPAPASAVGQLPVAAPLEQTLAVAFSLAPQGLVADTALLTTGEHPADFTPKAGQSLQALRYIPTSSPFTAVSTDLAGLWRSLTEGVAEDAGLARLITQPIAALQTRWKMDLPADVFHWVTRDYALGLLPPVRLDSAKKGTPAQPAEKDWIFVARRTAATADAIAHLDELATQQGYSVGELQLGERTVSAWTRLITAAARRDSSLVGLQAEVRGVHATVGDYEIITTSLPAMDAALQASQQQSLAELPRFQSAIAPFQPPNNGYLYLDWQASRTILERRLPLLKVVELAGKPFFRHLESLTLTSYGTQSGVQRSSVAFGLR